MIKTATKKALLRGYRQLLRSTTGFRFYNAVYEAGWLPTPIRNQLVVANRHIQPEELGSIEYTLRLIGTGRSVALPPIRTLRHWQFAQSYRWATPFYSHLIRHLLASEPAGLWIDIGANQGIRCLDAHDAGWQVWAYEPNAETLGFYLQLLQCNPSLTRSGDRAILAAVGDREGEVTLDIDASSYLSSVSSVSKPSGFQLARSETVALLRMDQELTRHQGKAAGAIVKIDVEGLELAVLRGFGSRLSQLGAVLVEVTQHTQEPVGKVLHQAGFQMAYIDETRHELVLLPQAAMPSAGTFDLLAWPVARPLPKLL